MRDNRSYRGSNSRGNHTSSQRSSDLTNASSRVYGREGRQSNNARAATRQNSSGGRPSSSRSIATVASRRDSQKIRQIKSIAFIFFFPVVFLYLELVLKAASFGALLDRTFFYTFLFSFAAGIIAYLICMIPKRRKVRRGLSIGILVFVCVIFCVEFFIKQTFTYFMGVRVIFAAAGDVAGSYMNTIFLIIVNGIGFIILFILPAVFYIFFGNRFFILSRPVLKTSAVLGGAAVVLHCIALLAINLSSWGVVTDKEFYTSQFDMTQSTSRFGLITCLRLDLQYMIFGQPEGVTATIEPTTTPEPTPTVYGKNEMDIDFEALAANETDDTVKGMHEYFGSLASSSKNEYTGMFEGKNCIFIVAEAFSPYCVSEELTPTLYKMMNNGFVFSNYYQPAWGVSTSDGEYSSLLGLVPKSGVNSMQASSSNNLYFTLGNQFSRLGYSTQAYHNNTYTYYKRNETHTNLGYSKFTAIGNGLEGLDDVWPRSDKQMIEHSIQDYIDNQPFHTYYMTVSGHALYTFTGNTMAYRNKDKVADMDASEQVKAYIACNLELEYALQYLEEQLSAAGILDDTVIVLTADHYPYGLEKGFSGNTQDYLSELVGHTVETNFELHKNALIIYNSAMEEPVHIDDPTYSLDILPTLSNLFGMEYDSRLLVGRDVLSDAEPLVLFRNYSWITDKGKYNSNTNTFTPNEGVTVDDNYVKNISNIVKNKVNYSKLILEKDYYNILFGDE